MVSPDRSPVQSALKTVATVCRFPDLKADKSWGSLPGESRGFRPCWLPVCGGQRELRLDTVSLPASGLRGPAEVALDKTHRRDTGLGEQTGKAASVFLRGYRP